MAAPACRKSAATAERERANGSPVNQVEARVLQQEFEGNFWQIFLEGTRDGTRLRMSMVNDGRTLSHQPGATVAVDFPADLAVALPEGPLAAE